MKFKVFSFIFLVCCFASGGEEFSLKSNVGTERFLLANSSFLENSARQSRRISEYPPTFDKNNPQAKGVILSFHRWPNINEKASLLAQLEKEDLKLKTEIRRFKTWVFVWQGWNRAVKAESVCKGLSDLSFLESCEPDYLVGPAEELGPSTVELSPIPASDKKGDLRSCNIVSSKIGLFEGGLSDYWAQEMIGSDLLKEEINKVPPIKKHLVETFDIPPTHDIKVKNLISDKGKHSVLPEMGNNIGITATRRNADALQVADNLLSKADKACGSPKPSQVSSNSEGFGTSSLW